MFVGVVCRCLVDIVFVIDVLGSVGLWGYD